MYYCSERFKLLCWNIWGLGRPYRVERARAVCEFIKAKLPHAVYLQEVINTIWEEIKKELGDSYECYPAKSTSHYYVAILVRKGATEVIGSLECTNFNSRMGRQLLQLPIIFAGANIVLMTSHLESTDTDDCKLRQEQLKSTFDRMKGICAEKKPVSCIQ